MQQIGVTRDEGHATFQQGRTPCQILLVEGEDAVAVGFLKIGDLFRLRETEE